MASPFVVLHHVEPQAMDPQLVKASTDEEPKGFLPPSPVRSGDHDPRRLDGAVGVLDALQNRISQGLSGVGILRHPVLGIGILRVSRCCSRDQTFTHRRASASILRHPDPVPRFFAEPRAPRAPSASLSQLPSYFFALISSFIRAITSATGFAPWSPSERFRTATVPLSRSFSPTTSM